MAKSMISRGFCFCGVALLLSLHGEAFQVRVSPMNTVRDGLSSLHSTSSTDDYVLAKLSSVSEGALMSSGLARRIRQSRSSRGRVVSIPVKEQNEVKDGAEKSKLIARNDVRTTKKSTLTRGRRGGKGLHLSYESALEALQAHHSIHGDLAIPRRFIVPKTKEYPKEWHGVDLASAVYNMQWWQKHVKQHPDRVAELNKLGFVWGRLQPVWNIVLEALITYSSINGDVLVPKSFVVPHGDEQYPKATWGIQLGRHVYRIRSRNDFLKGGTADSRRAQLDGLGFVWEVSEHRFRKFYYALRHFARLERLDSPEAVGRYRPLRVPSKFVVPSGEASRWPEELWGFPLGAKCSAVRQKALYVKNNPERQAALEELGFQWSGNATLGWLEVVHAAAIYSRMHNRNLDVPSNFVVPAPPKMAQDGGEQNDEIVGSDDAWPWPEQLWGLRLGQRLKDIRLKNAYLTCSSAKARRAQLDALGFNWTPKRGRRKKLVDGDPQ